ncbi:MAG: dihydroneopterin triphosphate diphosphatase [Betaproteobacteria bacterium]|nr:dihydroneopterin triphosphate diphosphatase [Betaproteobacteria bacterium]
MTYKRPESVLVVIHTPTLEILLLERADHPGWWQSVTGSLENDETPSQAAQREVQEETGLTMPYAHLHDWQQINRYEIYTEFRYRYASGVTHNVEHVFSLQVPTTLEIIIAPKEHLHYRWMTANEAAERCFSPSNAAAIRQLQKTCYG